MYAAWTRVYFVVCDARLLLLRASIFVLDARLCLFCVERALMCLFERAFICLVLKARLFVF